MRNERNRKGDSTLPHAYVIACSHEKSIEPFLKISEMESSFNLLEHQLFRSNIFTPEASSIEAYVFSN